MRRRITDNWPTMKRLWVVTWSIVLLTSIVLWVSEAEAQSYGRELYYGPYESWHDDMLREQRRQTQLMEQQEDRQRRAERRQNYEDQKERVRRYHESLGNWTLPH